MSNFDTYISLGSACQTSIQLGKLNMRDVSLCFDWMWNKESGLINIIDIFQDNFEKLLNQENYRECNRWKIINKHYSDIGFPHNDLLKTEQWNTFKRRILRMKDSLQSNKKICFIYFRDDEIPIGKNYKYILKKVYNHKEQIRLFKEETIFFREVVNRLYPNLNYHLKAFYNVNRHNIKNMNEIMKTYNEDKITYNIIIGKNKKVWKESIIANKYIKQNPYV